MKLDYDLIRDLLLYVEDKTDGEKTIHVLSIAEDFHAVEVQKIKYHLKYLKDSHYLQHIRDVNILDITPLGRDYLNSVREQSIWKETKKVFHPLGSVALSVVSDIATSIILKRLCL